MYNRLVKPDWGKKKILKNKVWVDNPNLIREIPGPDTYEGCFDEAFLQDKNNEGYNIYFFPNHPKVSPYSPEVKYLNGTHIYEFNFVFADMDLKEQVYASK